MPNSANVAFKRVDDRTYRVADPKATPTQFRIESRTAQTETCRHLAQKAFKLIADKENPSTIRFMYGGEKWKVVYYQRIKWYHRLLAYIFPFFHLPIDDKIRRFKIERAWIGPKVKPLTDTRRIKKSAKENLIKQIGSALVAANYKHRLQEGISSSEFMQGVRGKIPYTRREAAQHSRYKDPFSTLATTAFQNYEKHYIARDAVNLKDYDCRIIRVGDDLLLVQKTLPDGTLNPLITHESLSGGMKAYRDYATRMYGEEKVAYIEHQYQLLLKNWEPLSEITLENLPGLTPEHIYRFNIGTTNLEIQDIEIYWKQTGDFLEKTPLNTSLDAINPALPEAAWRKLLGFLRKQQGVQQITVQHLKNWKDSLEVEIKRMSPEHFATVMDIFQITSDDLERAYTGKKIEGIIQSAYTTAEGKDYKPWIDQQELSQSYRMLLACKTQEAYHELLTHIVVKKHLARRHPTEGYRVGVLVPVPAFDGKGPVGWYKVTSCISNQYSYSYTLEPACNDASLPAIKLYRSTASTPYAMFSSKTVINDFNSFNSPGYIGVKALKPYEQEFFQERTIPVWVGYQFAAEQQLGKRDLQKTLDLLSQASQNFRTKELNDIPNKSFQEVLKEHDAILNELYLRYQQITLNPRKLKFKAYVSHIRKLVRHYIGDHSKQATAQIGREAVHLQKLLAKELRHQLPKSERQGFKGLSPEEFISHFVEQVYVPMKKDLENANLLLQKSKSERVLETLQRWNATDQRDPHKLCDSLTYQFRETTMILELLEALEVNVLHPKPKSETVQKAMHKTHEFEKKVRELMHVDPEEAFKVSQQWSNYLNAEAILRGEDIPSKKQQNMCVLGHSLGGACAQLCVVNNFAKQGRIPLPGKECGVNVFDDPAIDSSDNRAFKEFGSTHAEMFSQLDIKFLIFRRQEAHDFIPRAGEEHLGATFSAEEKGQFERWCVFNAAVNERLATSKHPDIAKATTAHETRYLGGVTEGPSFRPRLWADYRVTYYDSKVQGTFDSRGHRGNPSSKMALKHYRYLYKKIWKYPHAIRFLLKDSMRKMFSSTLTRLIIGKHAEDRHRPPREFLDPHGNFVVTLSKK